MANDQTLIDSVLDRQRRCPDIPTADAALFGRVSDDGHGLNPARSAAARAGLPPTFAWWPASGAASPGALARERAASPLP